MVLGKDPKTHSQVRLLRGWFQGFADQLNRRIQERGGLVFLNCAVHEVRKRQGNLEVVSAQGIKCFDAVVVTVNTTVFLKIINGLPRDYRQTLERLKSLDALNVLLILRKRLMDRVYWLNVLDPQLPFVGMMEHTNMIHPRHYGGEHIIYLGGYFPGDHRYFQLPKNQIVGLAINQLKHMAVQFTENDVLEAHVYQVHHAQPVIPINYSSMRPSFITPIRNLFLANMDMIYPWDRGTNYAVELGNRVAKRILKS